MLIIGSHMSVAKGLKEAAFNTLAIGGNTFQFFTRNPRGGNARKIEKQEFEDLLQIIKKNHFGKILAHAPYTLNLCSKDSSTREFGIRVMKEDLERMENLPGNLYNFHPRKSCRTRN